MKDGYFNVTNHTTTALPQNWLHKGLGGVFSCRKIKGLLENLLEHSQGCNVRSIFGIPRRGTGWIHLLRDVSFPYGYSNHLNVVSGMT